MSQYIFFAQQSPALADAKKAVEVADDSIRTLAASSSLWDRQLVQSLTWGVLAFGAVVLFLLTFLLFKKDTNGSQILKCFGLVLIITLASILLIVGYSSEQLTPIIGLFGAIAGYLLGKETNPETNRDPNSLNTHVGKEKGQQAHSTPSNGTELATAKRTDAN